MWATPVLATAGSFAEVRERFGAPRLVAHLPIGAYEPRWFMEPQHMNPQDAVRALELIGAEQALGHHWGTFRLTNEGIEEPVADLATAFASRRNPAGAVQGAATRRGMGARSADVPHSFGWT